MCFCLFYNWEPALLCTLVSFTALDELMMVVVNALCPLRLRYLHKKLGANAPVCTDFLKGHCPKGLACDKRHVVEKRQQGQPSATGNSSALVALPEIDAVGYDGGKGNSSDLRPPASFIRYWERVGRKAPML